MAVPLAGGPNNQACVRSGRTCALSTAIVDKTPSLVKKLCRFSLKLHVCVYERAFCAESA